MKKCKPIVCQPIYQCEDCYVYREQPIIQPIIHVRRHIVVNVPRYYPQPQSKDVLVDPGCPRGKH